MTYKFQFNGDLMSVQALASLLKDGWKLANYLESDGYSWFILMK
jgi:hypothetical protein